MKSLDDNDTRVRLMIDSIVDYAIVMLDPEGRVTRSNSGAERITGYRAAEIVGEPYARFSPAAQIREGRPEAELRIASAEGRFSEEAWRARKDGQPFWASVVLTAAREDSGPLLGFTLVMRDLTERQRYEAQLVQAKADAEKANQAKSEFLARMSHELRTPLNSLLILAQLLADNASGNLTPKQIQYAQTIYGAGSDLLMLIDDVLDLARVESGAVNSIVVAPMQVADLRDFVETTFRQVAQEKGIDFAVHIGPAVPPTIQTDARRLKQVLKNLLSNAFKFTAQGSVRLDVSLAPANAHASERLLFAVSDTGIGVPEDKQQVIFEAFQQADDTTSRQFGGSGLGLAISREFTRLLGGEIRVSSAPGKGSTFTLSLPLAPRPLPEDLRSGGRA